ncbi:helix-turn-helix domain-containing protein [Amycolatopsis dongchuanensis]|uniref:TetR/AcrR family transcriptional regulator n=1 Tax=Amycolatopsis dongchuanensis TaxID=1070866 RepID=A0ABP8VGI7_9PSEU
MTRKARADAAYNREHIVEVARKAFAEEGLDLPVREIARRAGLAAATVHRHFPSRTDLVTAVLTGQVDRCVAEMAAAVADPDPGRALRRTVLRFAEHQLSDRGLTEALLGGHPAGAAFASYRPAQSRSLYRLVERARRAGAIREHVSVEDVRTGLLAIASFRTLPARQARPAVTRLANLVLAGITA